MRKVMKLNITTLVNIIETNNTHHKRKIKLSNLIVSKKNFWVENHVLENDVFSKIFFYSNTVAALVNYCNYLQAFDQFISLSIKQ